jgi:N-glycosylase/DNA lyase
LKNNFQVHNYSDNTKVRIAVFNLNGGDSIWWEYFKKIKREKESKVTWKQFDKYFFKSYLSKKYYDDKIKEFHELKL